MSRQPAVDEEPTCREHALCRAYAQLPAGWEHWAKERVAAAVKGIMDRREGPVRERRGRAVQGELPL
jgi:hypothetical protein